MKITNKNIDFVAYDTSLGKSRTLLEDITSITLPDIERQSDSISGAGILGEIDYPSSTQVATMVCEVTARANSPIFDRLLKHDILKLEVVWVQETLDPASASTGMVTYKAQLEGKVKKVTGGKAEKNAQSEGGFTLNVWRYVKHEDGKKVLAIDQMSSVFEVDGVDMAGKVKQLLKG